MTSHNRAPGARLALLCKQSKDVTKYTEQNFAGPRNGWCRAVVPEERETVKASSVTALALGTELFPDHSSGRGNPSREPRNHQVGDIELKICEVAGICEAKEKREESYAERTMELWGKNPINLPRGPITLDGRLSCTGKSKTKARQKNNH